MRKLYWYLSSYIRKHGLIVLLTIILAMVIFSFAVPLIARFVENKDRLYIGVVGYYSLDTLPTEITQLMSSGITRIEPDGSVIPDIAERWTTEDDGKTYRFVLKKNLQWQDGKPLVPEDIDYRFNDVETISTPNDIVFKLPEPFVPFPSVVSRPILRSEESQYLFFFKRRTLIGLAAYKMESYEEKGNRLLELIIANNQERRIYRFYLTEEDAVLAYKRGEVDDVADLSAVPNVNTWSTTETLTTLNNDRYLAVFFNLENPIFQKNIRQALSYAVTKPTDDTRANGPINPQSWAYLPGGKTYDYDVDRGVERMMAEIDQLGAPIQFELTTTPTFESDGSRIKQEWETLGQKAVEKCQSDSNFKDKAICENLRISVNLRITSFPDTTNFQALLIGQEIPPDPDQYYLWHSGQPTNFTHYRNTRIDSLLEKGRVTLDRTERLAIYQEFQQFFLEDAPAVFLRQLPSYEIKRK